MLTYAGDGTIRTIDMLDRGAPAASIAPTTAAGPTASPRPPLADEEDQAVILQRPIAVTGPLARAVGSANPPLARAAAREAALDALARDPEASSAYLSTLTPVDDAVLATMFRAATGGPGAAEEWMAALAARASTAELRAKAAAVLAALQRAQ
jgi:hypothetical protein